MAKGYIAYFQDMGYFYEGESEGFAYCFGVVSPGELGLRDWIKFSILIEDTLGLQEKFVREIDDMKKHLAGLVSDDYAYYMENQDVSFASNGGIFNGLGRKLEDIFDGNCNYLEIIEVEGVGNRTKKIRNEQLTSNRPLTISLPPKVRDYTFRDYRRESNEVVRKMMELLNLTND